MPITRREFLKSSTAAGVTLVFSRIDGATSAEIPNAAKMFADSSDANGRIDGLAKVTGQKLYARDFRAVDMVGWPAKENYAFLLRVNFCDAVFEGIDLSDLTEEIKPLRVIMDADLQRDGIGVAKSEFPEGRYLVPVNYVPDYYGQPVAILLFDSRFAMMKARSLLISSPKVIRKGLSKDRHPSFSYLPQSNIIKVVEGGGKKYDDRVLFSQLKGGPVDPSLSGERNLEAKKNRDFIANQLGNRSDWTVYKRHYSTQMTDPFFMEPESGLAWYESSNRRLHLLLGSQSPETDAVNSSELFTQNNCKFPLKSVDFTSCQLGGGFGGRDSSILCLYLAIAAVYSSRPVRILLDRFEQFQSGLKRHPSEIDLTIAISSDGKFQAIQNYVAFNAGGRKNISTRLAEVASVSATSAYNFPLVDINTRALHSEAVVSGSVRGFGVPQAIFGVECLVDEIADSLNVDPIELRRKNILHANWAISTGAKVAPPGMDEMCRLAQKHHIWKRRKPFPGAVPKSGGILRGVGFAVTMKNYGTGSDPVFAGASIDRDGKITVTTHAIEMGTGMNTTVATSTFNSLGSFADNVVMGEIEKFKLLRLKGSPIQNVSDPFWTPIVFGSSKASMTSSRTVFGVEQSSSILFELSLFPAAKAIWGSAADRLNMSDVKWIDRKLIAQGFRPLSMVELTERIYKDGGIVSVINHGFFRGGWAEADYTVNGKTIRKQIDALGVRRAGRDYYQIIERKNLKSFSNVALWARQGQTLSASACLVAVEINSESGQVKVVEGVHYLAPGKVLHPELLEGQMEGGYAEGLGYALMENLPIDSGGPSSGFWNLGLYKLPLAEDCAVGRIEKVILPPESSDAPARGIAEAVSCPIAPAIANAVANALGVRFRDLPITPDKILQVLSRKS